MKLIVLSVFAIACSLMAQAQPPNVPAEKGTFFGKKFIITNYITVDKLYDQVKQSADMDKEVPAVIKGVVTDVCTKEGCWIKVESPQGKMMVKMKDHAFLVPLALNGKTVMLNGVAKQKTTTVDQLRHYAEDEGKSKQEIEAITEPKHDVVFTASGVLVMN